MTREYNGHILATEATCPYTHHPEYDNCPVCDQGLDVCVKCKKGEIELDEPCEKRK